MKKIMIMTLLGAVALLSTSAFADNTNNGAVKTVEQRNLEIQAETAGIAYRMGGVNKNACEARFHGNDNLQQNCEKGWDSQNVLMNKPAKY